MKLSSEVKEDLQDQADQIIYFEAAMSNEDKASKAVYERLVDFIRLHSRKVPRNEFRRYWTTTTFATFG